MIKTDDLKKIVKLVLLSGYLKDHKPLSLMLVGEAGTGKTELITSYTSSKLYFATDLSYMGLLKRLKQNKTLTHIIIPDFIKITQKKRSTSDNLISILNAGVEEGIGKIDLYNFSEDFKNRQIGIIIATTKASYGQHKRNWESIGFVSRMIICSYSYSEETINEVLEYINSEEYLKNGKQERLIGYKSIKIPSTKILNAKLNTLANKRFRTLKQLQTLAKTHALSEGRNRVTERDIDEIIRLAKYINLEYTKL